jgi:hypothetical protein
MRSLSKSRYSDRSKSKNEILDSDAQAEDYGFTDKVVQAQV